MDEPNRIGTGANQGDSALDYFLNGYDSVP